MMCSFLHPTHHLGVKIWKLDALTEAAKILLTREGSRKIKTKQWLLVYQLVAEFLPPGRRNLFLFLFVSQDALTGRFWSEWVSTQAWSRVRGNQGDPLCSALWSRRWYEFQEVTMMDGVPCWRMEIKGDAVGKVANRVSAFGAWGEKSARQKLTLK